jgi:hypothetical protein
MNYLPRGIIRSSNGIFCRTHAEHISSRYLRVGF